MNRPVAITLSLCLLSTPALAVPPSFSASYGLEKYGMTLGESVVSLKTQGNRLEYQSVSKPRGMARLFVKDTITETSRLELLKPDSPLQLLHYSLQHSQSHDKDAGFQITWDSSTHGRIKNTSWKSPSRYTTASRCNCS